jgi:hypothetical protein
MDDLKNKLTDIKPRVAPTAKSAINHNIRNRLGISADDYCIIETCDVLHVKMKVYKAVDVQSKIGYDCDFIKERVKALMEMGLLEKSDGESPHSSDKWKRNFMITEEEFEKFMEPVTYASRKVKWTGSKADAKMKYETARKHYSSQYLFDRKMAYFNFLSRDIKRDIMMASVFLNVKTKRFSEEWETYSMPKNTPMATIPSTQPLVTRQDLLNT